MIPSPLINDRTPTNGPRRRSTGNAGTRDKSPILPVLQPQTSPRNAPPAFQATHSPAKRSLQPLQSTLIKPAAAPKSP